MKEEFMFIGDMIFLRNKEIVLEVSKGVRCIA